MSLEMYKKMTEEMLPLWADALADCGTIKENVAELDRRNLKVSEPDM